MDFSTVRELENKHAIRTLSRQNICFVSGQGNRLLDTNSRAYLDLVCGHGESCLGYGNNWFGAALSEQAQKLVGIPEEYFSPHYGKVLSKLLSNTGFTKACITGSAAEAIFAAFAILKNHLAEKGDKRSQVVIASCGGLGLGLDGFDLSSEGSKWRERERCDGIDNGGKRKLRATVVPFNDFAALKKALTSDTAVLVIEPIESRDVKIGSYDYLVNAYALCKSMGILLFCDETRIGIGRTGTKLVCENYGIQPDIITLSRGLGGGIAAGAVLTRDNIANSLKLDTLKTGGQNLLSQVAAGIVLDRLEGGILEDAKEMGEYLLSRLYKLTKYNFVVDVRGKGLLAAVELSNKIMAAKVISQMEKIGFLIACTEGNALRFSPSFTITTAEIDEAVDALMGLFASTNI